MNVGLEERPSIQVFDTEDEIIEIKMSRVTVQDGNNPRINKIWWQKNDKYTNPMF